MKKSKSVEKEVIVYFCPLCDIEFIGEECPECHQKASVINC